MNTFGMKLCEVLGLNPNEVLELSVHVDPVQTRVTVRMSLSIGAADRVIEETRSYKLVEVDS